jgi:hypothetical protein
MLPIGRDKGYPQGVPQWGGKNVSHSLLPHLYGINRGWSVWSPPSCTSVALISLVWVPFLVWDIIVGPLSTESLCHFTVPLSLFNDLSQPEGQNLNLKGEKLFFHWHPVQNVSQSLESPEMAVSTQEVRLGV